MSNLNSISGLAHKCQSLEIDAQIDQYKDAAVEILRAMASAVGTSYPLPPSGHLGEATYWDLDNANAPPTDNEITLFATDT
jgi:hypothetical protein